MSHDQAATSAASAAISHSSTNLGGPDEVVEEYTRQPNHTAGMIRSSVSRGGGNWRITARQTSATFCGSSGSGHQRGPCPALLSTYSTAPKRDRTRISAGPAARPAAAAAIRREVCVPSATTHRKHSGTAARNSGYAAVIAAPGRNSIAVRGNSVGSHRYSQTAASTDAMAKAWLT